jgi:hypothetical protein
MTPAWENIQQQFLERGVELNRPATEDEINRLQSSLGIKLPDELRAMYLHWNGFCNESEDDLSMISIWSIGRIFSWSLNNIGKDYLPFADFFLESELIIVRMSHEIGKVWWHDRGILIADGILDFCSKLGSGHFDIKSPKVG